MDKLSEGEAVIPNTKSKNPSRLWMLYHFWGGICLKAYVDVSGLSSFILGAPSGPDPSSASRYAGLSAMLAVGAVALGYLLSKSLVNAIDRGGIPGKGKIALKVSLPVIYFAAVVLLAMATAPMFTRTKAVQRSSTSVTMETEIKPVKAFTTAQSAEGMTESDLDQSGLKNLETWMVDTMIKKGEDNFAEMGYDPKDFKPKVSASSVYVTAAGKKIAVIKVDMDDSMRSVTIMGINGNELLRVSCIRAGNHEIPVWSGACGNELRKTFGLAIE